MSIRFLHTADVQIGARFVQFGEQAGRLREARVRALTRLLATAAERGVDAVVIAGDLFESNQLADRLVGEVFEIFAAHDEVPVFILPGNHDPCSGPASVWMRAPFREPPGHVVVWREARPLVWRDVAWLPVPIEQHRSTRDPSLPMVAMAADCPADRIKIGVTHGALRIEGKHQPNDHPIALQAARRAGLDYLAVGHWHTAQIYDDGRLVMPGTPEPDQFGRGAGTAAVVEIAAPGARPVCEMVETGALRWQAVRLTVRDGAVEETAARATAGVSTAPAGTVLRIELEGSVSADTREALRRRLAEQTAAFAVVQVVDRTSTALTEGRWRSRLAEHPLLAQAVRDVQRARGFATGEAVAAAAEEANPLTRADWEGVCRAARVDPGGLSGAVFDEMLELIAAEVARLAAAGDAE